MLSRKSPLLSIQPGNWFKKHFVSSTMGVMKSPPILTIPTELVIAILEILDFRTLITCRSVCRMFRSLIEDTVQIQYAIELAVAGAVDGPPGGLAVIDRLNRLRGYQSAWDTMTWAQDTFFKKIRGHVWELYGGVLAQCNGTNGFVFWQLPAASRDIAAKRWTVRPDEREVRVRDFTIDPSQDLLVIIDCFAEPVPGVECTFIVHFRSLSTGERHPLVVQPSSISFGITGLPSSFGIQASGDHVGVHLLYDPGMGVNQLYVWEWRTCQLKMKLVGNEMRSFSFLSDSHVLVAALYSMSAKLLVLNFQEPSEEGNPLTRCSFSLEYPTMSFWAELIHIAIRSDPMPSFNHKSDRPVPFHLASGNQLFVITMWVHDGQVIQSLTSFVPTSTIMAHISVPAGEKNISWGQWGPNGTRMLTTLPNSSIWVCYVYGSRFVLSRPLVTDGSCIEVYDFNQLSCRRPRQYRQTRSRSNFIQNTTEIARAAELSVFTHRVATSLPYRKQTFFMEHDDCGGKIEAVMCTEDNLVVVTDSGQFRVLTF